MIMEHLLSQIPSTEAPPLTKGEAYTAIAEVRQRVALMGANDSEFWSLDQIIEKMEKGELAPSEAVTEANLILNGKQDYH
ncbi:MAG: hypothetical protein P4L61_00960 [Candidatus Pacebacteria bacterium]|nr:hypothetical protein [Candidatus Paceibacterota bacterium]